MNSILDQTYPPIPNIPDYIHEAVNKVMETLPIDINNTYRLKDVRISPDFMERAFLFDAGQWIVTLEFEIPAFISMPQGLLPVEVRVDFAIPMR